MVSYLSVIVIAFLGVATFLGINYSDGALRINGSTMYNAANYRDLELISTAAFTQEDLNAVLDVEGVADAEPVWQTSGKASSGDIRQDIIVITLPERVNLPQMIEGRPPRSADECMVEQRLAAGMGWQMGDTVAALNAKGEAARFLKNNRFTIVGIANHPDHTSISIPDTFYVMVEKDAFDMDALQNGFMKMEVVVRKPEGIDRFSDQYEAAVDAVSSRLEEVAARRSSVRDEEIKGEALTRLDDAYDQLQKARSQLDEGWNKLEEGDRQIGENEAKLAEGQSQLMDSQEELMAGRDQLAEAEVKLAKAEVELSTGKTVLQTTRKQLNDGRQMLVDSWNIKEDAIEGLRNGLRSALGEAGDDISWASRRKADIDNRRLSAKDVCLTKSFKIDLRKSLKSNIRAFLDSGILSDRALVDLYLALNGGEH